VRLAGEGPHHLGAGHVFLQAVGDLPDGVVHCQEQGADASPKAGRHEDQGDQGQEGQRGQRRVRGNHQENDPQTEQDQPDEVGDAAARKALDGAHVFDAARDELPALRVIMKGKWLVLDVVVQAVAQVIAHARRDPLGKIALP
jgi:hypothetical protein